MKVDVSEIKSFKGCKRQWELSSRNKFHLQPWVTPKAFAMGTLFHESLHALYLGASLDKVMEMVKKEMDPENDIALLAMIPGYAREVLPGDLETYNILDIEHQFHFQPFDRDGNVIPELADLEVCGSIDMIALDVLENKIYGFEHKTAKNFRDDSFLWMDDQPRVYTVALQKWVDEYNAKMYKTWKDTCESIGDEGVYPPEPEPVTLGGIYINETKKLLKQFQYKRTLCVYDPDDLMNYIQSFFATCKELHSYVTENKYPEPCASYFGCQNCDFKTVCGTYQYKSLKKEEILNEFEFEFKERDHDHLEEKVERNVR